MVNNLVKLIFYVNYTYSVLHVATCRSIFTFSLYIVNVYHFV